MYVIRNSDGLVTGFDSNDNGNPFTEDESVLDCIVFDNGVVSIKPTPFHTASDFTWILTQTNTQLLQSSNDLILNIIFDAYIFTDTNLDWFNATLQLRTCSDPVKVFVLLKYYSSTSPDNVNIKRFF